jgi:anti-sigma factor RsiW
MAHDSSHENCRQLLGELSDYVDETASREICAEIERHMEGCENCRVVVDTLRKTISLVHETTEPATIPADVRQRLYKCLELDDLIKEAS